MMKRKLTISTTTKEDMHSQECSKLKKRNKNKNRKQN